MALCWANRSNGRAFRLPSVLGEGGPRALPSEGTEGRKRDQEGRSQQRAEPPVPASWASRPLCGQRSPVTPKSPSQGGPSRDPARTPPQLPCLHGFPGTWATLATTADLSAIWGAPLQRRSRAYPQPLGPKTTSPRPAGLPTQIPPDAGPSLGRSLPPLFLCSIYSPHIHRLLT